MRRLLPTVAVLLAACTSNGERIERLAAAAGLSRSVVDTGHHAVIFTHTEPAQADGRLLIFLEGDGRPWRGGMVPADDPTAAEPVALELLTRTPRSAAYVTRPCYHRMLDAGCTPEQWTLARYSDDIVASLANTVRLTADKAHARDIVLVGYSGGGTLAVLVAERLDNVAAVITVGANLDTDAWAQHHGYLPLTGSLNPARSEHEHRWFELHMRGAHDQVVPAATTVNYFEHHPAAKQMSIDDYDHVCCWVRDWTQLWPKIEAQLPAGR